MPRPRKSRVDKQSVRLVLHLTPIEKKLLNAAAIRVGLPVATLARLFVLRAENDARHAPRGTGLVTALENYLSPETQKTI